MAHGDYDCCAVCDCKLSYNSTNPYTKEEICVDCLKALRDNGVNVLDPTEKVTFF